MAGLVWFCQNGSTSSFAFERSVPREVHVFEAGRQEKSIYIGSPELTGIDSNLFKEPRGHFSMHYSMSPRADPFLTTLMILRRLGLQFLYVTSRNNRGLGT